jgi:maltose alpha-D-glucosyltransferase/alpha-amylase
MRSLHYAVFATIFTKGSQYSLPNSELLEAGGRYYRVAVGIFLKQYLDTATEAGLNIGYRSEIDFLLKYHILEKAVYELGYELKSRPEWVIIPLKGIMQILNND